MWQMLLRRNMRAMTQHPLPDDLIELIARRFRVLADPTRIKLLDLLREREATVQELTDTIGSTQQNVSKHLGLLRQERVEREARAALREAVGAETIPALRLENGSAVVGEENILAYLGEHVAESLEAEAHRQKAAKARRRYLEEECECSRLATR